MTKVEKTAYSRHLKLWNFKIRAHLKFVEFLNFAPFLIMHKKSQRFNIHGNIRGVLIFAALLCS